MFQLSEIVVVSVDNSLCLDDFGWTTSGFPTFTANKLDISVYSDYLVLPGVSGSKLWNFLLAKVVAVSKK